MGLRPKTAILSATLTATIMLSGCAYEPIVHLESGAATLDDQALQVSLQDGIANSKPIHGNRVVLLRDGTQTFSAMFAVMAAARDHINLEYFTFDDVKTRGNQSLGDLLSDRIAHGVQVDVIYDAYGSQATTTAFLDRLRHDGAHVLAFNPAPTTSAGGLVNPNHRDHRKILVVDGKTAFVGGVNLDPVYKTRATSAAGDDAAVSIWRDIDARIDGPAVADLQRLFLHAWDEQAGEKLPDRIWYPPLGAQGNEIVRIIGSSPGEDKPLYYVSALTAIHAARHSIDISTGYFVSTHQEREELVAAGRRGVKVKMLLPGKSDSPDSLAAGRAAYDDLLEAGVEIYEMTDDVLHAKSMVVDGSWTAVGSSNLDRRSIVFNNEVDAIILGTETGRAMTALLDLNRARSTKLDLKTWRARPLSERPHEWLIRFWQFLL